MTQPVKKSLLVPLPPQAAFDLFTVRISEWWPVDSHSLSARDGQTPAGVTVEPRVGGKIFETRTNGETADWATITEWEPGHRMTADWYVGRDPSEATCVSVRFLPEAGGTRVDLVHDGFDRLGMAGTAMAKSYATGWDLVLIRRFGGAARAATPAVLMTG